MTYELRIEKAKNHRTKITDPTTQTLVALRGCALATIPMFIYVFSIIKV